MKTYSIFISLLLISLSITAQHQLHMVTGNVIDVTKANYSVEEQFLIYVDANAGYSDYIKLWSVIKLVMEDGSEITFDQYDKTFDIKNHKHGDVYVTYNEPTNTELTLISETSREFMNTSENNAINQLRKLAYRQGGNILYVLIDQMDIPGQFSINYKIYSTFQFDPDLFDRYNGTFGIEGFNDGIKLEDWASPIFTLLGTSEKLIFKGDGVYGARSSKRVYEANLSFDYDNMTIEYLRVKKNGKRDEKSVTIRIVGNDENYILALRNESGYLLSLE